MVSCSLSLSSLIRGWGCYKGIWRYRSFRLFDLHIAIEDFGGFGLQADDPFAHAWVGRHVNRSAEEDQWLTASDDLIALYEAWGKAEEAEKWRDELTQLDDAEERG